MMKSELVISVGSEEISMALTEEGRLVELQKEGRGAGFVVGNIYVAKVKKLMPGLNACFVDVGSQRDAFLHYPDLGTGFHSLEKYMKRLRSDVKRKFDVADVKPQPALEKEGSVADTLTAGQEVLVQVIKEPISTKGPRLTCELSFAGRFLVLIPFGDKVSVSSKIESSTERARLKQLIQSICPRGYGVIVRTVADGKKASELDMELKELKRRAENTFRAAQVARKLPSLVYEETSRTVGIVRDLLSPDFEAIHIDNEQVYTEVRDYMQLIAPEQVGIVKLYKSVQPIFDHFNITRQIKSSFARTVSFKHGAYLIIEHTEALHVVDVNSGTRAKSGDGQEENALEVNLGAADELARQLRLRDIGGIIVVDFIDMMLAENRQKLYERMTQNMQSDRAKHNILPLSKFGLMQITRQRVRPAVDIMVDEECPTCFGTGKAKPSILFTDSLESKIAILAHELGIKKFQLHIHPYVAAYVTKGLVSIKNRWQMKYGIGFKLVANQNLGFLQYKFYDAEGHEIDMKQESEIR